MIAAHSFTARVSAASKFSFHCLSHFKFLRFACDRHGEGINDADVARHFIERYLTFAVRNNVVDRKRRAAFGDDPGTDFFAIFFITNTKYLRIGDPRVRKEEFFV